MSEAEVDSLVANNGHLTAVNRAEIAGIHADVADGIGEIFKTKARREKPGAL